jgi:IS30 family transposase
MDSLKAAQRFAKKNTGKTKRSKLDPHAEAIQYLLKNDFTLLQIQEFLENEIGLKVSYSNLHGWVSRRQKRATTQDPAPNITHPTAPSRKSSEQKPAAIAAAGSSASAQNINPNSRRKVSSPSSRSQRFNFELPK